MKEVGIFCESARGIAHLALEYHDSERLLDVGCLVPEGGAERRGKDELCKEQVSFTVDAPPLRLFSPCSPWIETRGGGGC